MQCICCLPVPNVTARKPSLMCFCEIEQTSTLVAGGKAPFLYFWNIASRKLIQVFRLPEETFREISALETIPDENTEVRDKDSLWHRTAPPRISLDTSSFGCWTSPLRRRSHTQCPRELRRTNNAFFHQRVRTVHPGSERFSHTGTL